MPTRRGSGPICSSRPIRKDNFKNEKEEHKVKTEKNFKREEILDKLHQVTHKKDEMIQVGELDPSQWTGVLLFLLF